MAAVPEARVATPADAERAAELLDAFNREFATATPGAPVLADRLRGLLGTEATFAVLAGRPAVSIGLVTLRTNLWVTRVALLDELYTVPEHRGRGLGTSVLRLALGEARRRGAGEFEVEVDEPDVDAHRFYARHGLPVRDPATGDRAFMLRLEL